jgi:hypothetical protein
MLTPNETQQPSKEAVRSQASVSPTAPEASSTPNHRDIQGLDKPQSYKLNLAWKAKPAQLSWIIATMADSEKIADFAVECRSADKPEASCIGAARVFYTILPNSALRVVAARVSQDPTKGPEVCHNATGYSAKYASIERGDFYCVLSEGWVTGIVVGRLPFAPVTDPIVVELIMARWAR